MEGPDLIRKTQVDDRGYQGEWMLIKGKRKDELDECADTISGTHRGIYRFRNGHRDIFGGIGIR